MTEPKLMCACGKSHDELKEKLRTISPWVCRVCNTSNPETQNTCKHCSKEKGGV